MAFSRGSASWRFARRLAARAVLIGSCTAAVLAATIPVPLVPINVRWRPALTASERAALEARYQLMEGRQIEGETFAYVLTDPSKANIRALVEDSHVEDTANLHRTQFRPPLARYRPWMVARNAAAVGLAGAAAWLAAPGVRRRLRRPSHLSGRRALILVGAPPLVLVAAALVFTAASVLGLL